jgi:lactococcin 972 family bacteriocin
MSRMRRVIASVAISLALAGVTATTVLATTVSAGGGTWNYGDEYSFPTNQHVWSHYVHNTLYHSATAICASNNPKRFANATFWANADAWCGYFDSTAVYWDTY